MKTKNLAIIACSIFSLVQASGVMAQGSVVAKVGTLGAGLEYVHAMSPSLAVGVGINGLGYSTTLEESDIDYEADLNIEAFSLLGDYHPMGNGFRISAGVMNNGNEFDLVGTPTGAQTVEVNGNTYSATDVGSLKASIGFDGIAPYLGIGWGRAPQSGKGWGFDMDLGVLFQDDPNVSLTVTCGATLPAAACTTLEADAAAEEVSLKADAEEIDVFPVISVGISYSF